MSTYSESAYEDFCGRCMVDDDDLDDDDVDGDRTSKLALHGCIDD